MNDFGNVGKLMYLPLADIEAGEEFTASEFLINAAAEMVLQAGGRNWQPLIVKETGDYQYQVVSNPLVYAVAHQANLERVWCIVIDANPLSIEQAKILAGETTPKVNLNTASRDTILAALRHLVAQPGSDLKGLDVIKATNRLDETDRSEWKSFTPITTLKCGITKGKKLDALQQVFFLSPVKKEAPPPVPTAVSVKKASRDDIFERLEYLSTYKIGGFETIDADKTADAIFTASKSKWKSLNPITKLECGIDAAKLKTLKTVLTL
ncbi:Rho termination factor [Oscillatoria amoena NRMC-F 0135]|nr:Rho termination factor [Geitlerinema splendidum]MDL5047423.1 Rho termination factor [Oscillatoria amoena NRMC-F 0135]